MRIPFLKDKRAAVYSLLFLLFLLSSVTLYLYLGGSFFRFIAQSVLVILGFRISYRAAGRKESKLIENLLGLVYIAAFFGQTILIWEGFYILKDIFAIAFTWGFVCISFHAVSRRLVLNFYLITFILMIYNASIAYNLYFLFILFVYAFLSITLFMLLIVPFDREFAPSDRFELKNAEIGRMSLRATVIGFAITLVLYMFFPFFWNLNFFNLPVTKNRNYFGAPDISEKLVSISGFSLDFTLSSGKVWNNPRKVMEVKTSLPSYVHYFKGAVYDTFEGMSWTNKNTIRYEVRNLSWQFLPEFKKSPFIHYETDTQQITYLVGIPNVLFYENYPKVIRFPARSMRMDMNGNIYIPQIQEIPFKYAVVTELPFEVEESAVFSPVQGFRTHLKVERASDRTRDLVRRIASGAECEYRKALAIEKYLKENYEYSLEFSYSPLKEDIVDYFLFEYKKGYCEQFATVLAVMLRLAGIPSRAVTGFAGGSYDASRNVLILSGNNAHAWAEAYFEGVGWITMDATPVSGMTVPESRRGFLSFLSRIFGTDPQLLVPVKVRGAVKKAFTAVFRFIAGNPFLMLLISAAVLLIALSGHIIAFLSKIARRNRLENKRILIDELEKAARRYLKLKRGPADTETEYSGRIVERAPFLSRSLTEWIADYLRFRYGDPAGKRLTNGLSAGLRDIKKRLKNFEKNI